MTSKMALVPFWGVLAFNLVRPLRRKAIRNPGALSHHPGCTDAILRVGACAGRSIWANGTEA